MLIPTSIVVLTLAVCGLATVRTAPAVARWLALLTTLAFAVVLGLADNTAVREVPVRTGDVRLAKDRTATRTELLAAAATAGPRAVELQLRWQPDWQSGGTGSGENGSGANGATLGAVAIAPESLPFAPEDVQIRAVSELRVDRPALFEVEVKGLERALPAELLVQRDGVSSFREDVEVGATAATVAFTPSEPGPHEVALQVRVGAHTVSMSGRFDVAEPDEILVVDPSGVVAAALRVQGERVRETSLLPSDWSRHARIVLGRAVDAAEQQALVAAVEDGTGLFVLPDAFGDEGAPLREALPIRVLPQPEDDVGDGDGRQPGGNEPGEEPPVDPPVDPPVEPPVEPENPSKPDSTKNHKPVSKDPIEVDKHAIAMVLVVDRSGSMGTKLRNGLTKMSYAKSSALRTAQALDSGDRVGVVSFGDLERARVELPMTDATDQASIYAGIEKLGFFNEFTYLLKGLRLAHGMLANEEAAVKHVVVISDGEFNVRQTLGREAFLMKRNSKITVSIISIIDEHTDAGFQAKAKDIAEDGGGVFVATDNVESVPVIVSSEVTRALARVGRTPRNDRPGDQPSDQPPKPEDDKPEDKQPEAPEPKDNEPDPQPEQPKPPEPRPEARLAVHAVASSPLLAPEPDRWPSLGRVVRCEAALESQVLLVAGAEGWPLLAFANRGLGRIGAFGADLGDDGAREFREHEAFPGWLAQWLRATDKADLAVQPADLGERGDIAPRAPVPADVVWLRRTSGGDLVVEAPDAPQPTVGTRVVTQVAKAAPWLLVVLLCLAIAEHCISRSALRRGRS